MVNEILKTDIPDDWDIKKLEPNVGFVRSGKRLPKGYYVTPIPTQHPYIRVADMRPGYVDVEGLMYVPDEAYFWIQKYRIYRDDIYISVIDNGMGMSEEIVENLLLDNGKVPKHGSGVGLINVHTRIQLMYGKEYGLKIYSEPDEGTEVVIHIPAIPFSEENRKKLEEQTYRKGEAYDEKK